MPSESDKPPVKLSLPLVRISVGVDIYELTIPPGVSTGYGDGKSSFEQ